MKYLLLICALFLSSSAEAGHGSYSIRVNAPVGLFDCPRCSYSGGAFNIHILPFDTPKAAIPYPTLVWPHLPSTAEVMIIVAKKRLAELVQAMDDERATEEAYDWDNFWVKLSMTFSAIGLFFIGYGVISGLVARKTERD